MWYSVGLGFIIQSHSSCLAHEWLCRVFESYFDLKSHGKGDNLNIEELTRLVRIRRSARKYKPDPVPDDQIDQILEVARWAMSGANAQPWEFVVTKDPATRAKMFDLVKEDRRVTDIMENTRLQEMRHPITGAFVQGSPMFKDAPVIITVCGDPRTLQATVIYPQIMGSERETYHLNMGNATYLIHLAAAALGLGTQWVSVTPVLEARLKALLGIPDVFKIPAIVPVGHPDYKPAPPYRRKLDELVHREKYDMARFRTDEDIVDYIVRLRKRTTAAYHPPSE